MNVPITYNINPADKVHCGRNHEKTCKHLCFDWEGYYRLDPEANPDAFCLVFEEAPAQGLSFGKCSGLPLRCQACIDTEKAYKELLKKVSER